ncbi:tetratricopeptide repeat protein [Cognaticolwellia mytili]|uniref:tetratricopeptide repeat protein n=1 Tax=Cognaticolwellia mytili TaxID=1888913 RepID=UPI001301DFC9|nr:tetratricopeptide repeat protein [Cognaticolwellia mytili]
MKYKMTQGRLFIGLNLFFLLISFKSLVFANNVDDWAGPLENAHKLLAKQQYSDALIAFKEQANLGNGLAEFNVALIYDLGWGIKPIRSTACQWYRKAAKSNMPAAMQALGHCFIEGQGVKQNKKHGYKWFLNAFEHGIADGGCHAGTLLLIGDGIEADVETGKNLCIKSAQQGSIFAQSQLAHWYFHGQYFPQDYQQSFTWLQAAASAKSPDSAYLLATFYDQGIGMNVDEKQALYWYEIAALGKYQQAYLPTALLYWKTFTEADSNNKEKVLAKSYLWAKTLLISSSSSAEKDIAKKLLTHVLQEIPTTWLENLDEKVANHLAVL